MRRAYLFLTLLTIATCVNEYYNVAKRVSENYCTPDVFAKDYILGNKVTLSDCVDH